MLKLAKTNKPHKVQRKVYLCEKFVLICDLKKSTI